MSLFDSLRFTRIIRLTFYTTSIDKLLQARIIFSRRGYSLSFSKGTKEPYEEDYSADTTFLLANAVRSIDKERILRGAYFIEDTSLRIEALSETADFPGMRVKEWFASTSFLELDEAIRKSGKRRNAIVKSDIALKLPNISEPILFHGETSGRVADTPPSFEQSAIYPWLSPANFNGWFIPEGQTGYPKTLGEMEFEESVRYDFRAKSLSLLLDQYDRLNAAANISNNFVANRSANLRDSPQLELGLSTTPPIICVVGYKCSGKTTFAHIAQSIREIVHLEASTFFRSRTAEEGLTVSSEADTLAYMETAGYDAVARSMIEHIDGLSDRAIIITGFRTPEEILLLRRLYDNTVVVGVSADQRIRFERHIKRGRELEIDTYRRFKENDLSHSLFGLVDILDDVADLSIVNDGSLQDYSRKVREFLVNIDGAQVVPRSQNAYSEAARSLLALSKFDRPATCDEISSGTDQGRPPIRKYNINRALKALPIFAHRIVRKGQLLSYENTDRTGIAVQLIKMAKEVNPPSSRPG
ncbi:non-canonical purine NTP pyrophosphatase [Mesorhizobium huakuii]|uniref:Non-canonical purine NTP pyrophosphatase n=1 Tax=Mesorhizobium huakuii TaxID=28104 RepID=A0ABZ0VYK7_9HYPH|nr:non-canonical purine NTP pyrophosphatase [Mesorhizobium huakuii]WQC02376.1 non-canonical purine NTP pyrophosphatase [Mesorhizobium huakuii]